MLLNIHWIKTKVSGEWPNDSDVTLVHIGEDLEDDRFCVAEFDHARRAWFCKCSNAMVRNVSHWAKITSPNIRTNANAIVKFLVESGNYDVTALLRTTEQNFSEEDNKQFRKLLGLS